MTPAQYATRMLQAYQETTHSRYDGNQVRYPETAGLRDINILDPCIPRVPDEMSEAGASVLWNEFDRLIAAENEYGYNPEHDMQNLDELFLPMVEFQDAAETGGDIVGGNMVNFPREKQAIQIPSVPAMQMAGTEGLDTPP